MEKLIFDVLNKNILLAHVEIIDNKVNVIRYVENVLQPFGKEGMEIPISFINSFLEDRCFNKNRPDKNEILEYLGLDSHNPLEIVKKTHGRILGDFTWIRFLDETLVWEDLIYEGI